MKKILFGLSLILSAIVMSYGQIPQVEYVNISNNGIDRLIIEKMDADASVVGADDFVRYRIFVDLMADWGYVLTTGTPDLGEMYVTSTGEFYNANVFGTGIAWGHQFPSGAVSVIAGLAYDSYLTSGGAGSDAYGVPYAVDPSGAIAGSPAKTATTPGLNVNLFAATASTTGEFRTNDGTFNVDGVSGGVKNITADNTVMIAQFTTNGALEFKFNIQTRNPANTIDYTEAGIYYTSAVNLPPVVSENVSLKSASMDNNEIVPDLENTSFVDDDVEIPVKISTAEITDVNVYPNPADDFIHVEFEGIADISIINMAGVAVETCTEVEGPASFDVSELPAGNYTITVNANAYNVVVIE